MTPEALLDALREAAAAGDAKAAWMLQLFKTAPRIETEAQLSTS